MLSTDVTSVVGLAVEGQVARLAGNGDAAVELHVTLEGRVNLVVLAAFLTNERPALRVNRLDVAGQSAQHEERLPAVVAVVLLGGVRSHVPLPDVSVQRPLGEEIGAASLADERLFSGVSPDMIEQHRLLAKLLVTLGALEAQLVIHVLVLVLETVGAKHLAAEPTGKAFLILGGVLVHVVLAKTVDPLERLALGCAVVTQAEVPAVLNLHGHVHLGDLHVRLVGLRVFDLLRNLVVSYLGGHLMMHHVLLERGSNLEHLSALVALELLDVRVVQLAVLPQIALLAKAEAAGFTNEGLLSGMGPHVRREDLPGGELLFAKFTLETQDVRKLDVPISQTV